MMAREQSVKSLAQLNSELVRCASCPRLVVHRESVARLKKPAYRNWDYWGQPVPGFGDPAARLLIVGLAPAAHGANRTGRMFTGDSSGNWLYRALHRFGFANQPSSISRSDGLELSDCYVTAAVRCAPPGNKPTAAELAECRRYLAAERDLLKRVRVVVVLGRIAHEAWLRTTDFGNSARRRRAPFRHGACYPMPDGTFLLCSYHPSRQNTNTGKLTRRMWNSVFAKARKLLATFCLAPAALIAQVAVHPLVTSPGSWERFSIRVANQWETPVIGVEVIVPAAVAILGVEPVSGWSVTRRETTDPSASAIRWEGGTILRGEYLEFAFLGRVAGDARQTDLVLPVTLFRSDDEEVLWSNPPGRERPAPRVRIVGTTQLSPWGSLALAGAAFVVAVLALILALSRRRAS